MIRLVNGRVRVGWYLTRVSWPGLGLGLIGILIARVSWPGLGLGLVSIQPG